MLGLPPVAQAASGMEVSGGWPKSSMWQLVTQSEALRERRRPGNLLSREFVQWDACLGVTLARSAEVQVGRLVG